MSLISNLWQDLRFGARTLRKNPGFALAAIITLALSIGGNTTIFSITSAVLLRPLPYTDPSQLVLIESRRQESGQSSVTSSTLARYEEIRDDSHSYAGVAAVANDSADLTGNGEPQQIPIARVSPSFFDVLGIKPQLGRVFNEEEGKPEGKQVVMISDSLWHSRFGANPNIVGQTVNLDSLPQTIIGVLPPDITFPFMGPADLWSPRYFELSVITPQHIRAGAGYLTILARLGANASIASATAEIQVLNNRYTQENPRAPDAGSDVSVSVTKLQDATAADVRGRLLILCAAVGVLLLIACANVASLLLSRALARRKEIAIRSALGAMRGEIIQQLLSESVLLGLIAGVIGVGVGWIATRAVLDLGVKEWLPSIPISMDWRVLGFALVLSVVTGIVFGIVPAMQLSVSDMNSVLRDEGRGVSGGHRRTQLQSVLVVSQVALSMLLLVGAGLLGRSFAHLLRVLPGFDPDNVLTMNISLPTVKYADAQTQTSFFDEVIRRVSALPGVKSAGLSAAMPLQKIRVTPILFEGQPELPLAQRPFTVIEAISPTFLQTMRIPLLAGRTFTNADTKQAPLVVIVNQTLARHYWPDANPVGKHASVGRMAAAEVVGVTGNAKNNGVAAEADPEVYLPFAQLPWGNMNLFVRTSVEPHALVSAIRKEINDIDPDQPITRVQTVSEVMDTSRAQPRVTMLLLIAFSATALVLAVVGIYGVLAYSVAQRRQEMGIRLALGAEKTDVLKLIVGRGLALTVCGIVVGWVAALALTRVMTSLLYEVGAHDLTTFVLAGLSFLLIAMLASYIPARRATTVDPAEVLRYE